MLTILYILIGFGVILWFGNRLVSILLPRSSFGERFSLAFIIGSGIFTYCWFLLYWAGFSFTLLTGFGVLIVISIPVYLFSYGKRSTPFNFDYFKRMNVLERIILFLIVFICLSAVVQTLYWPIRYWDSLVLYDFRAKVFSETGSMQEAINRGYFFGYPLLTSLVHTWVYLLGLGNPLFYYSFMYVLFIINFFEQLKKYKFDRLKTLFLTLCVVVSPRLFDHTQWGYTNLPYSIYVILGSIYLYWGIKNKDVGSYVTSAILIGLSTWTRTAEPFWLTYIIVAICSPLFIKKWIWSPVYVFVVSIFMFPWRYFQSLYNEGTVNVVDQVVSTSVEVTQNVTSSIVLPVSKFIFENVVLVYFSYFVLFGVVLFLKLYFKSRSWLFAFIIFINIGLTFAGTMIFAKSTTYWQQIPDSLSRMVMFLPVMIIFLAVELLYEFKKR